MAGAMKGWSPFAFSTKLGLGGVASGFSRVEQLQVDITSALPGVGKALVIFMVTY